ncbi:isoaspartyl peptidase/L-asparaginase, partial [bacterium]|nr:isoaspartyl peptidase/L-asparaginase [bacterium]
MKLLMLSLFILILGSCESKPDVLEWSLVLHGGAGTIKSEDMTPEKEQAIRGDMQRALARGKQILSQGGTALDAVEACIRI